MLKQAILFLSIGFVPNLSYGAISTTYYADILASRNIINTQTSGQGYRLNDSISRAELSKISANIGSLAPKICTGKTYSDVEQGLGDLCGYIEILAEAKVVGKSSKNFRPRDPITRAESIKILLGSIGENTSNVEAGFSDSKNLGDLSLFINRAKELGCTGDGKYFYPNRSVTRSEVFYFAACLSGMDRETTVKKVRKTSEMIDIGRWEPTSAGSKGDNIEPLSVVETNHQRISEEFNFKIYEAEIKAIGKDVILNRLDFVQFGSGDGINIGEIYKLDSTNKLFKLTFGDNERAFRYYKRADNPGISFDLYTGLTPGIIIKNGDTLKFSVSIDIENLGSFSQGKYFQSTNIFYAKYFIANQTEPISGRMPNIMVYSSCDDGVSVNEKSKRIIFDEDFQRNIFQKMNIGKYPFISLYENPTPSLQDYSRFNEIGIQAKYGFLDDYTAYQKDLITQTINPSTTYDDWLKMKFLERLMIAYTDSATSWLFFGYESPVSHQFKPADGVLCKNIKDIAKMSRVAFKDTYEQVKKFQAEQKYIDSINLLTQQVTTLQQKVTSLESTIITNLTQQGTQEDIGYYEQQLLEAQQRAQTYYNCLNGKWSNACVSYGF